MYKWVPPCYGPPKQTILGFYWSSCNRLPIQQSWYSATMGTALSLEDRPYEFLRRQVHWKRISGWVGPGYPAIHGKHTKNYGTSHFWLVVTGTWLLWLSILIGTIIGNKSNPTDELHHFSEGLKGRYTTNQMWTSHNIFQMRSGWVRMGCHFSDLLSAQPSTGLPSLALRRRRPQQQFRIRRSALRCLVSGFAAAFHLRFKFYHLVMTDIAMESHHF